jgi:hypothetical protein
MVGCINVQRQDVKERGCRHNGSRSGHRSSRSEVVSNRGRI